MPSILATLFALLTLYYLSFLVRLGQNYLAARKTNLPIITVPWDQNHYVWMATSVPLRPILKKFLPTAVYNRLTLAIYGWEFHEHKKPFHNFAAPQTGKAGGGKTFFLLTCGTPEINTSDPEFAWAILSRPRDFVQPDLNALFMAKFGANVLTVNGEAWTRQRRVVASVINERISRGVWGESLRLAGGEGLLGEVLGGKGDGKGGRGVEEKGMGEEAITDGLFEMMKKITILVLSGAGMGAKGEWNDEKSYGQEVGKDGHRMSYMDACKTVVEAVAGPIILPRWLLFNYPSFLPGHAFLRQLGIAIDEFPIHTREMLALERTRMATHGGDARANIMSQLAQATSAAADGKRVLSEQEMMGNLFVFTAAGYDTTNNTLQYALALLCRYPAWQGWICDEIDALLPAEGGREEELDYAAVFPRVVRIMAVMLETLRLFTPVIHLAKETKAPQTVKTSNATYEIPAGCFTYVDAVALHLDPAVWRGLNATGDAAEESSRAAEEDERKEDEYAFRPSRWVNPQSSSQPLFQPPRGSYVPWSAGPRVCPGQKMAQVEFTAIFLTLFRRHRIEAVPTVVEDADGREREETRKEVEDRLDELMRDSISVLTLQMKGISEVREGEGVKVKVARRR